MSLVSYADIAAQHNIPFNLMIKRLTKLQWDEPLAILLPPDTSVELDHISSDGKAYYTVPWHPNFLTARDLLYYYVPTEVVYYDICYPGGKYTPYTD